MLRSYTCTPEPCQHAPQAWQATFGRCADSPLFFVVEAVLLEQHTRAALRDCTHHHAGLAQTVVGCGYNLELLGHPAAAHTPCLTRSWKWELPPPC